MTPAHATTGVVRSVEGTNPGPASGITYTVDVNVGSTVPRRMSGVKPHNARLPDAIKTVAASVGSVVAVYVIAGQHFQFLIGETFEFEEACE